MTNQQHPITPPRELVEQWATEYWGEPVRITNGHWDILVKIATQAAQWGSDRELEACCEHLKRSMSPRATIDYLRAARRPEPKRQAEEALEALSRFWAGTSTHDDWELVRSALERLRELEGGDDRTTGANQ